MANKIYATGRRKTSVARVFLTPRGKGEITVNGKTLETYFPAYYHETAKFPLSLAELIGKCDIYATVKGGGMTGQAEAIRHGLARAINTLDAEKYHKTLKAAGLLTRDDRSVQRKHYGLKKARKGPQFSKR